MFLLGAVMSEALSMSNKPRLSSQECPMHDEDMPSQTRIYCDGVYEDFALLLTDEMQETVSGPLMPDDSESWEWKE